MSSNLPFLLSGLLIKAINLHYVHYILQREDVIDYRPYFEILALWPSYCPASVLFSKSHLRCPPKEQNLKPTT